MTLGKKSKIPTQHVTPRYQARSHPKGGSKITSLGGPLWQLKFDRHRHGDGNPKAGDHLCSQNLNCHMPYDMASDTLWNRSKACIEQIKKMIDLFRLQLWFSSFPPWPDSTPCSRSPSTFCWLKLSVGRNSIDLALYLPLGGGDDQGRDAGDQISFISIAATNRSFWPNFKCRRGPPRLVFLGPPFGYDLAWYLAVTCWVGIFDFLQSVTCEIPYCGYWCCHRSKD